jgi:hypothetical protein
MELIELLTVEDSFDIAGHGVVMIPDFPIPDVPWKNRTKPVVIVRPNGSQFQATARIDLTHMNLADPHAAPEQRWRIVVSLPQYTKADVPPGSKIFVMPRLQEALGH